MTAPRTASHHYDDYNDDNEPLYLRRFNMEEDLVFDNQAPTPTNPGEFPLGKLLDAMGDILDHADRTVEEIDSNLLGSAIVRGCQEMADALGGVAEELERQSDDDRRNLAQACLVDATTSTSSGALQQQQQSQQQLLQDLSVNDIMTALAGASTLLRDVESSLRGIEQGEADEIADVALTLARLFIASLQSFHTTVVQTEEEKRQEEADRRFEFLEDDEDDDNNRRGRSAATSRRQTDEATTTSSTRRKQRLDRLKVLWPPLGPAVASACEWGKEEAVKQPILAVALGMTLWPAAVATAFFGAPLVLADAVVQHAYTTYQEGPIVSNLEKSAAQVYQAGKLSLLTGKLVARQSMRILHRQLERHGGVGPVAQNLAGMAVDRVLHPVETVTKVWEGLHWAWDALQENVLPNLLGGDSERRDAAARSASEDWQQ